MDIVFFDMDHTLIRRSTGTSAIKYYWKKGEISVRDVLQGAWFHILHYLDLADAESFMEKALQQFAGRNVELVEKEFKEILLQRVVHDFFEDGLEQIAWHKKIGHRVYILSASSRYILQPLSDALGVGLLATEGEEQEGCFTGKLKKPIPYGAGKLEIAAKILQDNDATFANAWFYTDSHSDLPLLERVGNPVAVNPDWRLRRVARRRGWRCVRFTTLTTFRGLQ